MGRAPDLHARKPINSILWLKLCQDLITTCVSSSQSAMIIFSTFLSCYCVQYYNQGHQGSLTDLFSFLLKTLKMNTSRRKNFGTSRKLKQTGQRDMMNAPAGATSKQACHGFPPCLILRKFIVTRKLYCY